MESLPLADQPEEPPPTGSVPGESTVSEEERAKRIYSLIVRLELVQRHLRESPNPLDVTYARYVGEATGVFATLLHEMGRQDLLVSPDSRDHVQGIRALPIRTH